MPDQSVIPFVMRGAREAMETGLFHIHAQVDALESAVSDNPGLAFDLAKTLVESTCRAVLQERSVAYSQSQDLPRLFRSVRQQLSFVPEATADSAKADESLKRTLGGLATAIQGICELRNQCGFASHGAGSPRPSMERVQALLAANAADAIIGFLYRVHRQDADCLPQTTANFDEEGAFNEHLDQAYGPFTLGELEFRPSEVLCTLEPESYRIYLTEFEQRTGVVSE